MKKFYTLLPILCLGALSTSFAQNNYKTITTGSWSNPAIWDLAGGKPPLNCSNCNITIKSNTTVILDVSITLTGNSVLNIGDNITSGATTLSINPSNTTTGFSVAHNIMLDGLSQSKILLPRVNSKIDATTLIPQSPYDGIFSFAPTVYPIGYTSQTKIIGINPSVFTDGVIQTAQNNPLPLLSGVSVINPTGTLPIILSSFTAQYNNTITNLAWVTASEVNFSHFDVLRSGDGATWASIGTVAGKNAANGASYSFTDPTPLHGTNFYRLRAVDLDGKTSLSEIKQVEGSSTLGFKYGPNPANDHIGVTFGANISSSVTVRLFNQSGQALHEKQLSNVAGTTYTLPLNTYPAGIYTLQVKTADGSENSTFRVLVSH